MSVGHKKPLASFTKPTDWNGSKDVMKILVGSKNPAKRRAVQEAFSCYLADFTVIGISVKSQVSHQPLNDLTFEGALNRAMALKKIDAQQKLNASFFVGIEGGVIERYFRWFVFGAICILDSAGQVGFGTSPHFEIPPLVVSRLKHGFTLGEIVDEIMAGNNKEHPGGTIGYFTRGIMKRDEFYRSGVINALVPFLNQELFFTKTGERENHHPLI